MEMMPISRHLGGFFLKLIFQLYKRKFSQIITQTYQKTKQIGNFSNFQGVLLFLWRSSLHAFEDNVRYHWQMIADVVIITFFTRLQIFFLYIFHICIIL